MALEPNEISVDSAKDTVFYIDPLMMCIASYLGPEAINGVAIANKDIYERLSDRMLCSALVDGCFGEYGGGETLSVALQQKYLAKIEERGIGGVLMNEIKLKLRGGEDASNFSYLTAALPLNKWMGTAITNGRLVGVERMDVTGSLLLALS